MKDIPTMMERRYWASPICVFSGICWLMVGLLIGVFMGIAV